MNIAKSIAALAFGSVIAVTSSVAFAQEPTMTKTDSTMTKTTAKHMTSGKKHHRHHHKHTTSKRKTMSNTTETTPKQ